VGMSFTKKNYPQKNFQPRDIIERVLNEENFLQQSAAGVVAKALSIFGYFAMFTQEMK